MPLRDSFSVFCRVMGGDGTLYLVSRKLKDLKTGREAFFRDDFLMPLWRGKRHSQGGMTEKPH